MKLLTGLSLVALLAAPAYAADSVTGTITDSECTTANHKLMGMGDTDAECTKACIEEHGATYLLYDGKNVYKLSDQKAPAAFAGKKVVVTGTVDAKTRTIRVESIAAAK
jgi:hypothetical protein